jgi:4-amino-4-deoxy-L-arabinose transferase-like glycosyltransferase
MIKSRILLCLLGIAFVFFFLRTVALDAIPVFVDEAIYVRWSQVMKSEASLRFLPQTDGKQPLFMWTLIPVLSVIDDPLIAGRFVSIMSGFGTLVGLMLLVYLITGKIKPSLWTGLIYAVTPYTVFFDRMALVDSMLATFSIWTMVFSLLFVRTRGLEYAMLVGFTIGFGLITKSPAVFFYLIPVAAYFLLGQSKISKLKLFLAFLSILFISQFVQSILRLGPGFEQIFSRNQDYLFTFSEVLSHPLNPLIGNLKWFANWLLYLGTPIVVLFLLYSFRLVSRTTIFFLSLALVPLLAQSLFAKVYTSRYALYCFVTLLPLIGISIAHYLKQAKLFRFVLVGLGLLISVFVSLGYYLYSSLIPMTHDMRSGYYNEWTAGYGNKQVSEYLLTESQTQKSIVIYTEGFFGTMPDGIQIYTQHQPNIRVVGVPPIVKALPLDIEEASLENQVYFLVNQSRNQLPPSQLERLELIQEFPKLPRLDGTREVLQFYRYL